MPRAESESKRKNQSTISIDARHSRNEIAGFHICAFFEMVDVRAQLRDMPPFRFILIVEIPFKSRSIDLLETVRSVFEPDLYDKYKLGRYQISVLNQLDLYLS